MKRLLLSGMAMLGLVLLTQAHTVNSLKRDKTAVSLDLLIDTSNVKGFENLFVSTVTASNGSRLNPHAVGYVQDFVAKNQKDLEDLRDHGLPYLNLMGNILVENGLPAELKYLAVIESELKSTARSGVGAVGPWQLMPETARLLGLKVNHKVDERKNYRKSTKAAALYLKDLYSDFGDWLLVIAAYNSGSGTVYKAIKKSHSRNFWVLQYNLPAESRNHVKKFIGTQYALEGQGGVTTLTKAEAAKQLTGSSMYVFARKLSPEEQADARTITVSGKYQSGVIAKYVLLDSEVFNRYNPDFDKVMASENNSYDLKLPADKMDLFVANKYQILNESVQRLLMDNDQDSNDRSMNGIVSK